MRARRLLAPLLAALALLATPALASADAGRLGLPLSPPAGLPPQLRAAVSSALGGSSQSDFQPLLELKARDGFRLGIAGAGNAVLFEVVGSHGRAATAYVVRGTATPRLLRARFGQLGSVSVRFHPFAGEPNPASRPPRCRGIGGGLLVRHGVYVGRVHFRGEGGYLTVNAHRAKGRISRPDPRCNQFGPLLEQRSTRPSRSGPVGLRLKSLTAGWHHGTSSASFGALSFIGRTLFIATAEESVGALAKVRFAVRVGSGKALSLDSALTQARVTPPAPFHGSGIYRAAPDGTKTWTGPLSVNYPGAPRTPLTGDPFEATVNAGF